MYRKGLLHHHHCSLPACLPVPFTNAYNRPTTTSFPFFSLFFFLSVGVSVIFISIFIAVYIPSSSSSSSIALYQWQYYCVHRFLSMFIYAAWRPSFFFSEKLPSTPERTNVRANVYENTSSITIVSIYTQYKNTTKSRDASQTTGLDWPPFAHQQLCCSIATYTVPYVIITAVVQVHIQHNGQSISSSLRSHQLSS